MCTPLTTDRLMRWKLRRKTSNFFSCSLPLRLPSVIDDDDDDDEPTTKPLQNSEQPKTCKSIEEEQEQQDEEEEQQKQQEEEEEKDEPKDIRINDSNPKLSSSNRCSSMFIERFEAELPEELHCPAIADGDYIVFCFKEDGEFDIVKEKISGEFDVIEDTMVRLRPINRKLIYNGGENKRADHNMLSEGEVDLDTRNEWDSNTSDEKVDDGESIYFDPESPTRNHEEDHRCGEYEEEEEPTTSVESSNSTNQSGGSTNRSDGSTGSFAFPVLNKEWTGSPIKMPNLRSGLHMRRHRDRKLIKFQCCKF